MNDIAVRQMVQADWPAVVELNQTVVELTSAMDSHRLAALLAWSVYHKVITVDGVVAGFLLVMPTDVSYDSDNYRWFTARMQNFYYVDRIVVAAGYAGKKLGSRLYADLFAEAGSKDIEWVTCEYNIQPLNQASQAFHDRFGFAEVGRMWSADQSKQVSFQAAPVSRVRGQAPPLTQAEQP